MFNTAVICPSTCSCKIVKPEGIAVDCSERQLHRVPTGLPLTMVDLKLSGNLIQTIDNNLFSTYTNLKHLDMSRNLIYHVEEHAFGELSGCLKELFLDGNRITVNNLTQAIFDSLKKLTILQIHNNIWQQGTITYGDFFIGLTGLEQLSLDGLPNVSFGKRFSQLQHLNSLHIYDGLGIIRNETFDGLESCNITELVIRAPNDLHDLESMSFAKLHRLETLDLAYNQKLGFETLSKSWIGLGNTSISTLILTRTVSDDQQMNVWTNSCYRHLERTRIRSLSLDKNNIVFIDEGLHKHLPNLKYLNLAYNRLSDVLTLIKDVAQLKELRVLDVSHQMKRVMRRRSFDNADEKMNVTSPKAAEIRRDSEKFFEGCRAANHTPCPFPADWNLSKPIPMPPTGPWCVPVMPKLEVINLTQSVSVLMTILPLIYILGPSKLSDILYAGNGIEKFAGPFVLTQPDNNSLLSFDLSQNNIRCFAEDVLTMSISRGLKIGRINLSQNDLSEQLENDPEGRTFLVFTDLTELDLSSNGLKTLAGNIFKGLTNLTSMNISSNSLRLVEFAFTHMINLRTFDLSNNLMSSLELYTRNDLDKVAKKSNLTVNLYGNPLQCSCSTHDFLHWMECTLVHIYNLNEYVCLYDGKVVQLNNLDEILAELDFLCSTKLILTVAASLVSFLIIVIAISICINRHKWDIRFFVLHFVMRGKKAYKELEEDPDSYEYDAFVAYHKDDRNWVVHELIRNLEGGLPGDPVEKCTSDPRQTVRLCVHDRDFLGGALIQENILQSIERSRKTILVISKNFARSSWCEYELQMARMQSFNKGREIIVAILLEPVDVENFSKTLGRLIRKNTYIEWHEEPAEREEFWTRLRKAVSKPTA